ncbi:hypothetical protein [Streptomyces sp. TS71-3]|uniref:hypothetical protein n=1 Tax=Streptomyces sp. TS71-3 TaxID=2733862 RepID=UPI001BB3D372|nr:hypothetical protein [Streptomyces sp. TS71-3]
MARQKTRFSTLDLQLEAIADILAMAQREPDPDRRADLLLLAERSFAAYYEEHKAVLARRGFKVIKDGAIVAALLFPLTWLRAAGKGPHRKVIASAVTATIGAGAVALAVWPGGRRRWRPP